MFLDTKAASHRASCGRVLKCLVTYTDRRPNITSNNHLQKHITTAMTFRLREQQEAQINERDSCTHTQCEPFRFHAFPFHVSHINFENTAVQSLCSR